VLRHAVAAPGSLVIGIDASADAMADVSRRAARRGPRNALFFAEGAERLTRSPLAGVANLVTVTLPWGSLLRGVVGLDAEALAGVCSLLGRDGRLEVLASVVPSDRVDGLDCLDASAETTIRSAWRGAGIELLEMRPATAADLAASGSSWARRLGPDRPVWRLGGRRLGEARASASIGQ
jgi:16S rRNA (adenine(1408)-N(1))-methyltransferase